MNLDSRANWELNSQRNFWNRWDSQNLKDDTLGEQAIRRGETVLSLLRSLNLREPKILELGCGNGWLAEKLNILGAVTGVDLSDEAIAEAQRRVPSGTFYAGDALSVSLPSYEFDVVVTLETFSHVANQPQFIDLMARVLRPRGYLIITTQNRAVYTRRRDVLPPEVGQLRRWVTMKELRRMLTVQFEILKSFTIEPSGNRGFLRVVNSQKLNRLLSLVISGRNLTYFKEWKGWGQTLVVLAIKKLR